MRFCVHAFITCNFFDTLTKKTLLPTLSRIRTNCTHRTYCAMCVLAWTFYSINFCCCCYYRSLHHRPTHNLLHAILLGQTVIELLTNDDDDVASNRARIFSAHQVQCKPPLPSPSSSIPTPLSQDLPLTQCQRWLGVEHGQAATLHRVSFSILVESNDDIETRCAARKSDHTPQRFYTCYL